VPSNFHQAVRLLSNEIGIDTFVCTVSPMDRHGYMSFGTGNDSGYTALLRKFQVFPGNPSLAPRCYSLCGNLQVFPVRPQGLLRSGSPS